MSALICEVVYRGIFQKNLAARIVRGIVLSARKSERWGIAFGRYGDSPQRNGIPAKDFAIVADTKEELEQNMARYEPKHVDVTICVDDTLSKGVESWAWYGLQPINRLTVPDGTVLMTSLQPFDALLKDIHKKDAPYKLSLIRAKASFSGLWVYKEDHTEVRILGALAKIAPSFLTLDAVAEAIKEMEWGSELKVASARKAFDRIETRAVKITEGNSDVPFAFEMPKWWEMREGVTIPAIPIGKPKEGGQGYVPERNPYFKKFSTRTMRPVIDFDTCVKCNLDCVPRLGLRRDARRHLRRQHGGVLRLRRVRGRLPRRELHHDGQRVRLRRQRQPVGDVAQGQNGVQDMARRQDRRQENHGAVSRLPFPRPVRRGAEAGSRVRRHRDHRWYPG